MLPFRYPILNRSELEQSVWNDQELSDKMMEGTLESNSSLFPSDIYPLTSLHVERLKSLMNNMNAMMMPGNLIEDSFCCFFPTLNSTFGLYGTDYALLYAYSRLYLHNLGQNCRKQIFIVDRTSEMYEEVHCQLIGLNRISSSIERVEKFLLLAPTSFISDFELIYLGKWHDRMYKFSKFSFDKKLPPSARIPDFGGSINFDKTFWIQSQNSIFDALKLYTQQTKSFLLILQNIELLKKLLTPNDTHLDKIKIDYNILNERTVPYLRLLRFEIEDQQLKLHKLTSAISNSNNSPFFSNDLIVCQKIINTIHKIIQKIEKEQQNCVELIKNCELYRNFSIWISSQNSIVQILDQKVSLRHQSIDHYNLIEILDECEHLMAFVTTIRLKFDKFKQISRNFLGMSEKLECLDRNTKLFEKQGLEIKQKIIEFASQNDCQDEVQSEKLRKYFLERPRQTLEDLKPLRFFQRILQSIDIGMQSKQIEDIDEPNCKSNQSLLIDIGNDLDKNGDEVNDSSDKKTQIPAIIDLKNLSMNTEINLKDDFEDKEINSFRNIPENNLKDDFEDKEINLLRNKSEIKPKENVEDQLISFD